MIKAIHLALYAIECQLRCFMYLETKFGCGIDLQLHIVRPTQAGRQSGLAEKASGLH